MPTDEVDILREFEQSETLEAFRLRLPTFTVGTDLPSFIRTMVTHVHLGRSPAPGAMSVIADPLTQTSTRKTITFKACLGCRIMKIKCDRVRPKCGNCTRRGAIKCEFDAVSEGSRQPPRATSPRPPWPSQRSSRSQQQQALPCTSTPSTARYSPQSQHNLSPSTLWTSPPPFVHPSHSPISPPSAHFFFSEDEDPHWIVHTPSLQRQFQTLYAQHTSLQQPQQPPPSTWTPSSTRICQPSTALYSQHTLSPSSTTPWMNGSTTPRVDRLPLSFTTTSPALQPSPPIPILSTWLPPPLTRTPTPVGGPPPSALEDPKVREKVLQAVAMLAYGNLSLSAAMLNVNPFSSNPITKVPLVIATTTAFFAVVLHGQISLQLHVFEAAHHINHIKRPFVLLVAFLAVSIFATLFALPAHSWSQEECSPYCWAERALVSTVVIGGIASLMIGGRRMRDAAGRLATRVD